MDLVDSVEAGKLTIRELIDALTCSPLISTPRC